MWLYPLPLSKRFLTLTTRYISEQSESISKMSSLEMELDAGEENLGDDILSLSTADEIQVSLT